MKTLLTLITLAIIALGAVPAQAQLGNPQTLASLVYINGGDTSNINAVVSLPNSTQFAAQVIVTNFAATTATSTLTFQSTVDNVNWVTAGKIIYANTGTTSVNAISNFTAGAAAAWRLNTIAHGASTTITGSFTVITFKKPGL